MRAADVLGRVILVTGKEEFLGARTVEDVKAAVREHDAEAEFSDASAADLTLASLGEMAAPSLFSAVRCVVVRNLENLPDESVEGLVAYAGAPVEDVALVLVHGGGQKGSGVLTKPAQSSGPVTEHKSEELKPSDFPGFVAGEVRRHGATIDREAAVVLIEAVGRDLRSLAGAASQPDQRLPGGADRRGAGPPLLRGPRGGEVLRRGRRGLRRPRPGGAGGACAGRWTRAPPRC
ncbi:hypothetical protein [Nocardioides convexus]|uniref:DNA polymerase III subunit delta n=1 Tax=Nocardioides convexus TaxID=2712224 RepID=UPI0024187329|nr:hypothetical protein [Nocardioides convexus]